MKRMITMVLLVLATLTARSQALINYTEKEVRTEVYPDKITTTYLDNGHKCLQVNTEWGKKWWYIDKNTGLCYLHIIVPATMQAKSTLIEYFNKNYVVVNSKRWKVYTNGVVLLVKFMTGDNGEEFIGYMEEEE